MRVFHLSSPEICEKEHFPRLEPMDDSSSAQGTC